MMVTTGETTDISSLRRCRLWAQDPYELSSANLLLNAGSMFAGIMPNQIQHHTVPRVYLQRFAKKRQLSVLDMPTGKEYLANVKDVTTRRHFYAVQGHPTNPNSFEDGLGSTEGRAARVLADVDAGVWPLPHDDRVQLAVFMTLQFLRGPDHRRQLAQLLNLEVNRLRGEDPEELTRLLSMRGAPPVLRPGEGLPESLVAEAHLHQISTMLPALTEHLLLRRWRLIRFEAPSLLTSDAPLTPVLDPREQDQSAGLGLENAYAILFPLTRTLGLQMYRVEPSVLAFPGVVEALVASEMDTAAPANEHSRASFNTNTAMHADRILLVHPDDVAVVPRNYRRLRSLGGRIDFSDPPEELLPAPWSGRILFAAVMNSVSGRSRQPRSEISGHRAEVPLHVRLRGSRVWWSEDDSDAEGYACRLEGCRSEVGAAVDRDGVWEDPRHRERLIVEVGVDALHQLRRQCG